MIDGISSKDKELNEVPGVCAAARSAHCFVNISRNTSSASFRDLWNMVKKGLLQLVVRSV